MVERRASSRISAHVVSAPEHADQQSSKFRKHRYKDVFVKQLVPIEKQGQSQPQTF